MPEIIFSVYEESCHRPLELNASGAHHAIWVKRGGLEIAGTLIEENQGIYAAS